MKTTQTLLLSCLLGSMLTGCKTMEQMTRINDTPPLSHIQNPTEQESYKPVSMPMPAPEESPKRINSLWQTGAKAFFKDQRAKNVGDILTVQVNIDDSADTSNVTNRSRATSEAMGAGHLFGLESQMTQVLPEGINPSQLVALNSSPSHTGTGTIKRSEKISMTVAATIIQILPNGNYVIEGRQEVRVNYEVRQLVLRGIVRPEDIAAANTITLDKVAQARLSYGGRGQLDDMQQPPYGQQVLNALSPF